MTKKGKRNNGDYEFKHLNNSNNLNDQKDEYDPEFKLKNPD